jgi:hypothetical protein
MYIIGLIHEYISISILYLSHAGSNVSCIGSFPLECKTKRVRIATNLYVIHGGPVLALSVLISTEFFPKNNDLSNEDDGRNRMLKCHLEENCFLSRY